MNSKSKTFVLPNGNKATIDNLIDLYREEQLIPFADEATISKIDEKSKCIQVVWSINSLEKMEKIRYATEYIVNLDSFSQTNSIEEFNRFEQNSNLLASLTSDSRRFMVNIKKSDKNNSQTIEIIDSKGILSKFIDIKSTKHDSICLNPRLSSISFSPDESKLMYIAERKTETESYFKNLSDQNKINDDLKQHGNEYEYTQTWGEQFDGISHTCVCILTINKQECEIKIIDLADLTLGQPFWINNEQIAFIAIKETPKRLGLKFCKNRVTYLYKCKLAKNNGDKDELKLIWGENHDLGLVSPQINPQKNKVVFFENPAFGPHGQATRVKLWNLETDDIITVFDLVEKNQLLRSLFIETYSTPNYWTEDGLNIVLTTIDNSKKSLILLNVITKKLQIIKFDFDNIEILGLKDNLLVVAGSSPSQQPVIFVGSLNINHSKLIELKELSNVKNLSKNDKLNYRIIKQNDEILLNRIQTIVIGLSDQFDSPSPAIVIPHGGPHSSFTAIYNRTFAFYAKLGFKVCLINYRGSLNISDEYCKQLCGNIGDMDVKDCISAINNLVNLNLIDKNNISLFGGSHGGFIVCHLIGQYPDFGFRCCVARNPVTDISKKFCVSDIPDWSLVEVLGLDIDTYKKLNNWYDENDLTKQMFRLIDVGKPELLELMFNKSPIKYIDQVKTPVLMMLGFLDQRVPHYQGLSYVNALNVRGVNTKTYMYQDNHGIAKLLSNSSDFDLNVIKFILDHLLIN